MFEKKTLTGDKKQSKTFLRILRYIKPYKWRLVVGILAGLAVGGSLFFSIILIPKLAGALEPAASKESSSRQFSETSQMLFDIGNDDKLSQEQKLEKIEAMINPVDDDPKLQELVKQIKINIKRYNLPAELDKYTLHVHWPKDFSFEIINSNGRMAWQILLVYMLAFVGLWFIKSVAIYVNHYYTAWVGNRVVNDLRNDIFAKITRQSLEFFGKIDVGQLISRTTNDTAAIQNMVATSLADLSRCPLEILACVGAIIVVGAQYNDYSLPIIMFIGLPVILMPIVYLKKRIRNVYGFTLRQIAVVYSKMHEVFSCIKIVKAYNTEDKEIRNFNESNYRYFRGVIKVLKSELLMSPLMEFVTVLAVLAFLLYSFWQDVTMSQIFSLLAPAFMIYKPIKDLAKVTTNLQKSMAAADRYFELIDVDMELKEKANPVDFSEFKDKIALENVSFAYDDHAIVNQVSFDIPKGGCVAVVGETGSGKTTIANLIGRFYDVSSGAIKIDGVDVRDFSIKSLRKQIGTVTQEAILFNESIAYNIAYGAPHATHEEIINAAKQANAHEFIVDGRHADGYDTIVGEKGFKLSGGEKQRISIARAILQNPPILILDEATSALDTVTEKLVQEALNKVMTNRTVFVIAHRLSTIQDADMIIVLEQGRIIEQGTHAELIELNGKYRKLHDTQFAR